MKGVSGRALVFATHRGSVNIRPIKEVVSVEVARSYHRARIAIEWRPNPFPTTTKVEGTSRLLGSRDLGSD